QSAIKSFVGFVVKWARGFPSRLSCFRSDMRRLRLRGGSSVRIGIRNEDVPIPQDPVLTDAGRDDCIPQGKSALNRHIYVVTLKMLQDRSHSWVIALHDGDPVNGRQRITVNVFGDQLGRQIADYGP